jgi:hypothetical protein
LYRLRKMNIERPLEGESQETAVRTRILKHE